MKSKAVKSIKKKHAADPDDSDAASATAESDHESSTNDWYKYIYMQLIQIWILIKYIESPIKFNTET